MTVDKKHGNNIDLASNQSPLNLFFTIAITKRERTTGTMNLLSHTLRIKNIEKHSHKENIYHDERTCMRKMIMCIGVLLDGRGDEHEPLCMCCGCSTLLLAVAKTDLTSGGKKMGSIMVLCKREGFNAAMGRASIDPARAPLP